LLNLDWHFFPVFDGLDPATAYPGIYNVGLVATSVAIAILAAFVAFSISGRIAAATTRWARYAWASAGAISMGGGIWSMHFVGMLAFSLPCGIAYDPVGTVLSMIPGMMASGIALAAISTPDEPGLSRRSVSALLMGGGIAAMHYSGMAAMRPEALLRYNPALVAISVVVAVVLAFVSLSIRFHRPRSSPMAATLIAASVMGCAVAGMHYTAMQASTFFPLPGAPTYSMALSPTLLALLITIFTVLIAVSTLVATFAGRQNELALSLSGEISRRKRIEEDLRRSEAYLAEAQRLSHTGSWAFNVATRQFIHSSEEHHRLFGFDPREGMPGWVEWIRRLHPEDRERTMATVEQGICERADFELDYRATHPDGTIKYIHALSHPVLNSSGDLVEFVGTSIDMTERRRAEEARLDAQNQLAHANRVTAMGQLAASIAHEVNQPIAATVTNAQAALRWLDRRPPDLEEVRQTLARIAKDGNRAAEVIEEIRALIKRPRHGGIAWRSMEQSAR
jgi:PAS domain S-box-containing protein